MLEVSSASRFLESVSKSFNNLIISQSLCIIMIVLSLDNYTMLASKLTIECSMAIATGIRNVKSQLL